MGPEQAGRHQIAAPLRRTKSPRWHYVYFLLAAFDLVTVLAGLTLNHRIMAIYLQSVEVNRVWAERVAVYSHLGELAGDVDAPGNDVFDTRDVQKESVRMEAAVKAFDLDLLKCRQELEADLDDASAAPLLSLLDKIAVAKTQMTQEAARIFDYFREGRSDLAGERMATMDHKYASLNEALLQLRRAVGAIQQQNFAEQTTAAKELQRYEYGIGLSIVLMVLGATFYGHKIARQMQSHADERDRHFNDLQAAEMRTRSILDTAAEGIVSFDDQGRIEVFNRAAEQLFGLEPGHAIGRDIRTMIPAMADGIDAAAANTRSEPAAGSANVAAGERVGVRRDGTQFPLELSVSAVTLGRARTFTAIVRDISDRRKAEEALAVAAAAQAANRAKSQFLANMSHEIRTPMSGVLGMAEILLETALTPTQRRYAESVHRSGESLLKIIDGILDFSKIEAGKVEFEHVEFRPRDLVEEVTQLLREGADKKGLQFGWSVAGDVPDALLGAPSRLRQILINLVGNAIKFTDAGGVAIRVSTADHPDATATSRGTGVAPGTRPTVFHFAVEDTGIGIDPSAQSRLFRAFEQADSSTTRSYGGTGLGLAISRELVEKMGGRIGVRSAPGRGSEFWFTVPLEEASLRPLEAASRANDTGQPIGLDGIRVLLAEDNAIIQDVAVTMLQSLGCQVRVVDTGAKALAALEQGEFDIVFMDRQMPEMDGFDTTAEIRRRGLVRPRQPRGAATPVRLPVVGLTASALKGDREVCIAAGMDDYLAKPFKRTALRIVLERWVLDHPSDRVAAGEAPDRSSLEAVDSSALGQAGRSQRAAGPRLVVGLIAGFFDDAPALIETLQRAFERSDLSALAHAAHLLGMRSEFVGAGRLSQLCAGVERAAHAGERADLERRIPEVRRAYEAVRLEMDSVRSVS